MKAQATHEQSVEQVEPGWHVQSGPQAQEGAQAQLVNPSSAATWVALASAARSMVFMIRLREKDDGTERTLSVPHSRAIERSGYSGRTLAGVMPNMLLNVREKCAESANPPV